ncbi:MAG: hypothetical protein ACJ74Z_03105 [Bryobacteraceae bacterium]
MPANAWPMVKRIVRAYGAAQDDENGSVENVAKLAGIHRPVVSGNNNFLRSLGILEIDKPKLTSLGVKLATGIAIENLAIVTEALQDVVQTTPVLLQILNVLKARGPMDISAFRGQIILAAGLKENSPGLTMIKTVTDLLEDSQLIEIRDDKVHLRAPYLTLISVDENGQVTQTEMHRENSVAGEATSSELSARPRPMNAESLVEKLLAKFPEFDPAWTDDVKLKWFDAFDRLMKGRGM